MSRFARLGNDLYEGRVSINFVGRKWLWYAVSGIIVAVSIYGLLVPKLNWGIEFEGGVEYRVSMAAGEATEDAVTEIRTAVEDTGIENASAPIVNTSGEDNIRIQTEPLTNAEALEVGDAIEEAAGVTDDDISRQSIGPSWGEQVADRALIGLAVFLVLVVLLIWAYFREWKMSVAAIVALAHDVVITIGVYALSGFEVTPATVTGVLTILGFSLYDTVVVFDKVRENTAELGRTHQTYAEAANLAVNQTLVRSINTSIVALIPIGAILYVSTIQLGASSLKDLALAQFVGMAAGLFSSIFIAPRILVQMKGSEAAIQLSDKRARSRAHHDADRYANIPAFTEDMPVQDEPGVDQAEDAPVAGGAPPVREQRAPEAMGRGRNVPEPNRPVQQSGSSGRQQPSRQPRSKRGKK
jgi:preprotein translocase subunit SecF